MLGERAEGGEDGERDHLRLRRGAGRFGTVERDLERAQLRRRDRRQLLARDAVEEVDQRGEGELGLGAAAPRDQHPDAALPRLGDALLHQAGLADAGGPVEQHGLPGLPARQPGPDGVELGLSRDQARRRRFGGRTGQGRGGAHGMHDRSPGPSGSVRFSAEETPAG